MPRCLIIAGPNGAGKTTFALEYLLDEAGITRFLNADMIASGLSPLAPEEKSALAGRLFLKEIEAAIQAEDDFAFETTLSGRGYLQLVDRLRKAGWGANCTISHCRAPNFPNHVLPNASATVDTIFPSRISSGVFREVCAIY